LGQKQYRLGGCAGQVRLEVYKCGAGRGKISSNSCGYVPVLNFAGAARSREKISTCTRL